MLGELFNRAIPFILLPYLTRELGPTGYGALSLYQSILLIIIVISSLSLDGAVTRYYYRYGIRNIHNIILSGLSFSLCLCFLIFVLSFATGAFIISILAITAFFQLIVKVVLALCQCQKFPLKYVKIQVVTSLLSLVFTLVLFELDKATPEYRITAILCSNLLVVLTIAFLIHRKKTFICNLNINRLKLSVSYLLGFGAPLIFHNLAMLLKGQSDKLILASHYSLDLVGVYSSGFQMASIFLVVFTAINKAITPYFYQAAKEKRVTVRQVRFLSIILLFLPILIYIPISMISEYAVIVILGEGFKNASVYFSTFTLGVCFMPSYFVLVNFLFYKGKTKIIAIATILTSILYFSLVVFLSKLDITLTPFSLVMSNLFLVLMLYTYVCHSYKQVEK